jgi:glycosyltransferase involved in cell wall biosynthesis
LIVTLLVPCHDEAQALPELFPALEEAARRMRPRVLLEFLLVDDGSFDDTLERLDAFAEGTLFPARSLGLRPNRGLGAALRESAPFAAGEAVVTYDADRPYPLEDLPRLLAPIRSGDADVVTASPWHREGSSDAGAGRSLVSRAASACYRLRFGGRTPLATWTCGYRAWRRETFLECLPRRDGFCATAEMLVRAVRSGARVAEVPSRLRRRTEGRSKMRVLRTALTHAGLLLRGS